MSQAINETNTLLSLVIIAALAFVVPLVTSRIRRVRVPNVVGEIVAGMIVGGVGFNWVQETDSIAFLSEFGLAYLMFLSGIELDFKLLRRRRGDAQSDTRLGLQLPISVFLLTLGLTYVVSVGLVRLGFVGNAAMMTLILSTVSLGIVTPVLKERRMLGSVLGQRILTTALISDFGAMVLLTLVVSLLSEGSPKELLLIFVLFAAFFIVYRLGTRVASQQVIDRLDHATSQIGVRGSFMLILIFVALAVGVGSELILGAFLAGAIVSLLSDRLGSTLHVKLDAIGYGFFIPVFFIMVGVRFDGRAIVEAPSAFLLVPSLLIVVYAVQMVAALLFRKHHSWRESVAAGFLLCSRLSLTIAAVDIGLRLGVISPAVNAAIILLAIVTSSLSPVLFGRVMPEADASSEERVFVLGANRRGLQLGRRLRERGYVVQFLDANAKKAANAEAAGFPVVTIDTNSDASLQSAGVDGSVALVAASSDEELNLGVVRTVRRAGLRIGVLIAAAESVTVMDELRELDAHGVTPALSTLLVLENLVAYPALFSALHGKAELQVGEGRRLADVTLANPKYAGYPLGELGFSPEVLVLSVKRGGEVHLPRGRSVLHLGDRITLLGEAGQVMDVAQNLGEEQGAGA